MKTSCILAALAACGASYVLATPVDRMVVVKRDNLRGLSETQTANACAVLTTGLTEACRLELPV